MSARDRILARLKKTTPVALAAPDVQQWAATHRITESLPQRVTRLREALEASHAEVHLTDDPSWRTKLAEIVADKGIRTLLIGTNLDVDAPAGLDVIRYETCIDSWRDKLFTEIDAGLTRAKSAIAATGTLVLWPDADEPRLMSLVPPIHLVLVDAATIHADFSAAMVAENWKDHLPTNALLISGPSKTADIQQTLAYGAHGPRELIVLVILPEGSAA